MFRTIVLILSLLSEASLAAAPERNVQSRVDIYYAWTLEHLLPLGPNGGSFTMRVVPWRDTPELLLIASGIDVKIRQPERSLRGLLRELLQKFPLATEEQIVRHVAIKESAISVATCKPLEAALNDIRGSHDTAMPSRWSVHADGPQYTLARSADPFMGETQVRGPHEEHPVVQAWLRTVLVLNQCGANIVAALPKE